jgi:threonine/homoserine/homoserine lactone efflux protein
MTGPDGDPPGTDPRPAPVTFVTTEHFTLQGARAATIAESTGRATMFLSAVSGGLVALGLIATATRAGTAFYAFGLVILPTLAFVGVLTFDRTLQSGIEDHGYGRRIARLRAYYFDYAPELTTYLQSVEPRDRLAIQGLRGGWWQAYRTVAGMIAVITAVLTGSAAGLIAAVASGHSLTVAVATGAPAGVITLAVLMQYQQRTWQREGAAHLRAFDEASRGQLK